MTFATYEQALKVITHDGYCRFCGSVFTELVKPLGGKWKAVKLNTSKEHICPILIEKYGYLNCPYELMVFLYLTQSRRLTEEMFFNAYVNETHLHNHTLENFFLYMNLSEHLKKKRVFFYPEGLFICDNRKYKWWLNAANTHFLFDSVDIFSILLPFIKKKTIFYSPLLQQGEIKEFFEVSTYKEAIYNLNEIFLPETYYKKYEGRSRGEIKKKIYNRVVYPFLYLSKHDFKAVELTEDTLPEMEAIHAEWCAYKLAQDKTFKIMFSTNRYNRAVREMYSGNSFTERSKFYCKLFYWEGKPFAVRQCLLLGDTSYDIGFFSLFWTVPSQLLLYLNAFCLKELQALGVVYHYTGMVMDKYLEASKNHFPAATIVGYKYKFKKSS